MDQRPYFHFSGSALADLVDNCKSAIELMDIRDELWQRSERPSNLRLIVKITTLLDQYQSNVGEPSARRPARSAEKNSGSDLAAEPSGFTASPQVGELEILRRTFTTRSEILARWGLNENLPKNLQEVVFAQWEKTLTQIPDSLGRSIEKLSADLATLAKTP